MRTRSRRVVVAVMAAAMLVGSAPAALAIPTAASLRSRVDGIARNPASGIAALSNTVIGTNGGPRIGSVSNTVIGTNGGPRIGSTSNSVIGTSR